MKSHSSFKITDIKKSEFPGIMVIFFVISVLSVAMGLLMERLPDIVQGLIIGLGLGWMLGLMIYLYGKKETSGPEHCPPPSDKVLSILHDSEGSLIEAIKVYREETGVGLNDAARVLKRHQDQRQDEAK